MLKIERRVLSGGGSVRAASESGQKTLSGYAAIFSVLSEPIGDWRGSFTEKIDPHAFDKCLASAPDLRCLKNHDVNFVLGRTKSKTLTVAVDAVGLKYTCKLPDTTIANDLFASVQRGDISGASFAFETIEDSWNDETNVRTLLEANLADVSVVTFPAYGQTSATADVRSLGGSVERIKLGVYDGRALRLPSLMTDADRRKRALDLRRELRGDDDEAECSCECDSCIAGNCSACDCSDGCTGENCASNEACECASYRSARSLPVPVCRTIYPNAGNLDPVSAFEAAEAERKIAYARWLAGRDVPRY